MKRVLPWIITMLLAITLIALVFIMVFNSQNNSNMSNDTVNANYQKRLSAEDLLEVTVVMNEIKTNLASPNYVAQTGFAFQLDSKKSAEQFEKIKDIKVKPVILKTLSDMKVEDLEGKKGKDQLAAKLIEEINKVLPQGKVIEIDVTECIMMPI